MKSYDKEEEQLVGGNVSNVYRSGDTVRRELKPGSEIIHLLLKHLHSKGFSYSPRFLGIDDNGREVLSFIKGEAGNDPIKEYMRSNHNLKDIANMLRLYHDAVADFPHLHEWEPMDHTPGKKEVVCHNDFALYNIIFNEEKPVGIIDFDVAAPGPRLWDIAYTLYTCVPLSRVSYNEKGEPIHYQASRDAIKRKERITLFFEAYSEDGVDNGFLDMVLLRIEALCQYIQKKASAGDVAFQQMIDEGHLEHYKEDLVFIRMYGDQWM